MKKNIFLFLSLLLLLLCLCPLLAISATAISAAETTSTTVSTTTTTYPTIPKLQLDWRMDLVKENVDHNTQYRYTELTAAQRGNSEGNDIRFALPVIRLDLKGKLNKDISYRARYRLNRSTDLYPANVDETGPALDYAYVEYKGIPDLTLRFGKDCFYHGGWESSISSKDGYSYSLNSFSLYRTGVGAFYTLQKIHQFGLQVMNNQFNEYNQEKLLYGASYQLALLGGIINPLISYHVDPRDKQVIGGTTPAQATTSPTVASTVKATNNTYFAIGNRVKFMNFIWDVDYLANKTEAIVDGERDSTDKSYVSTLFYKYKSFRPQIKYAQSKAKSKDIDTYTRHDYHAVVEYYFNPAEDFRVHVGFIGQNKDKVNGSKYRDRTYMIGMAGSF
ncbi:MAG: hypothetical protein HQK49_00930 [Oligoflexia bacterium]|nr:hypothetical protein [Oligoflexia bacterium]